MNTEEVAKKVVELVRKQAWHEALELYDEQHRERGSRDHGWQFARDPGDKGSARESGLVAGQHAGAQLCRPWACIVCTDSEEGIN